MVFNGLNGIRKEDGVAGGNGERGFAEQLFG
jgi:hypothetical protein